MTTIDISDLYIDRSESIDDWSGPYAFLRNDYSCKVELDGDVYPTAEHAFQASKTLDLNERATVKSARDAREAKRIGRNLLVRNDWDAVRVSVMERVLRSKFSDYELGKNLIETGNVELKMVSRGDSYWGVTNDGPSGEWGENVLGKLLMRLRQELADYVMLSSVPINMPLGPSLPTYLPSYAIGSTGSSIKMSAATPPPPMFSVTSAPIPISAAPIASTLAGQLCALGLNAEVSKAIDELCQVAKKVVDKFGDGDKTVLEVIAGQIANNPEPHANVVSQLGKSVEAVSTKLKALENG